MSNIIKHLLAAFAGAVRPLDLTPVYHDSGIPCPPAHYLRHRKRTKAAQIKRRARK